MSLRQILTFVLLFSATVPVLGQDAVTDSLNTSGKSKGKMLVPRNDSISAPALDSLVQTDTLSALRPDTIARPAKRKPKDASMDSPVKYHARDSIRFSVDLKKVYLFGEAQINYEDIELKAEYIEIDQETKEVYAIGVADSTGKVVGRPQFKSGEQEFVAEVMRYNFNTKKGRITEVVTQEGDGNLRGTTVKKLESGSYYIRKGGYTTCDADHPHYIIAANKLKVIPNDKVVSGPAFLMFEGVYTPLVVPFGWFPNQSGRSSGIIFPEYGDSPGQGFFFRNMGYYFNLGDRIDLQVTGDIYTEGSYGLRLASNYNVRYRFNGQVEVTHNSLRSGDKVFGDLSVQNNYFFRWRHTQDPKARPSTTFTANVNAGSATNFTTGLRVNPNDFLTNTFQSSIAFSKRWIGTPFSFNTQLMHQQNTNTRNVSVTFPDVAFNMTRIFPFARRNAVGKQRWYEKIGVSYAFNARNQVSTVDSTFFSRSTLQQMRNGMSHAVQTNTSFRVLKHFTLAPSVNYTERWFFQSIKRGWDNETQTSFIDTTSGFFSNRDLNANVNLTTQIYGLVQFKKGAVRGIRHVITPTVGYNFRPRMGSEEFGYYGPGGSLVRYNPDQLSIFGMAPNFSTGAVTLNLNNNLEMKVRSKKDTVTGMKKVKLLEAFNVSTAYNIFADSLNLQDIRLDGRTTILERLNINFGASFTPYAQDSMGRKVQRWHFEETGQLTRLVNAFLQMSFNLNSKARNQPLESDRGTPEELMMINAMRGAYVDFNVPWNIMVSYNLSVTKAIREDLITNNFNVNGDINITPKWKVGFSTGYDFHRKEISQTSLSIYRDLHCWDFSLNWIPFGTIQSWSFDLKVKSAMLQDLKLSRRKDYFDF